MTALRERSIEILVVEGDGALRGSLFAYLRQSGCSPTVAADAAEAQQLLANYVYDVAILDVEMPGGTWLGLFPMIRREGDVPIILLTAQIGDADCIYGLELGADDYIVKPFNPRELIARVKAILHRTHAMPRRAAKNEGKTFFFGGWTLQSAERDLIDAYGRVIKLSPGECRLLIQFMLRPRTILSRHELVMLLHGQNDGQFQRSIDNQISRIRKKVESSGADPTFLQTVWGGGYMLAWAVRQY
jgi:two-component system, OmpR family, response regulator